MDESGTHDAKRALPGSEVAAIAGYVSKRRYWVRFQRAWRKTLKSYGVHTFHMSEYAHGRGEFEGWSKDKRDSFLKALSRVIDEHKLFGVGGLISVREYESLLPDWAKLEVRHPYYFCFAVLMKTFRDYYHHIPPGTIDFVFDRRPESQHVVEEMFEHLKDRNPLHGQRLGKITFDSKERFLPLQAADLLVYEVRRYGSDRFYGSSRPTRKSMEALMVRRDLVVGYYDADDLRAYVRSRQSVLTAQDTGPKS